ncbi:MAG: DUF7035 domain-containing protein, partial [Flavobacteriaceae bacterium]
MLKRLTLNFISLIVILLCAFANAQDFDRPIASALTVSPSYVDISSQGATITLSVQISDASTVTIMPGYSAGYLREQGEDQIIGSDQFSSWSLVSGDQFNGTYQATKFLSPSNIPSDTFRIQETFYLEDAGGLRPNGVEDIYVQVRNDFEGQDFDK